MVAPKIPSKLKGHTLFIYTHERDHEDAKVLHDDHIKKGGVAQIFKMDSDESKALDNHVKYIVED